LGVEQARMVLGLGRQRGQNDAAYLELAIRRGGGYGPHNSNNLISEEHKHHYQTFIAAGITRGMS
jgi:hypothetical protein